MSLPSAHIENLSTVSDILDSVSKWIDWGLTSYPMNFAYRLGPQTVINDESELRTWAETQLGSNP
jgi:hypothetical protein